MKKVMFFLLFISLSVSAKEMKHGLGFAAGQISGIGLSYRNVNDMWAWQFTFGAISNKNDWEEYDSSSRIYAPANEPEWWSESEWMQVSGGRNTYGSAGINIYRYLHKGERSSFYTMGGLAIFFEHEKEEYSQYFYERVNTEYVQRVKGSETKTETHYDQTVYFGAGIGIEFLVFDNIRIAFELPLTFSNDGDFFMYIPQTAIQYMF